MVYFVGLEYLDKYDYGIKALDGDLKKIQPVDLSQDEGIRIKKSCYCQGRVIENKFIPQHIQIGGPKRRLADVIQGFGSLLVSQRFRDIVEQLEPGVHQFFAVELLWKDGSHAAHRFWFNVCNRIDSIDRNKSTVQFDNIWLPGCKSQEVFVFNKSRIGNRHVWIEKFISGHRPYVSNSLKEKVKEARITGLSLKYWPETE